MTRFILLILFAYSPLQADIEQSIDALSAETFQQRKAAYNNLLDTGPAAIPLLKKQLKTANPELKFRAQTLLRMIELGITSSTPEKAIPLIKALVIAPPPEQIELFTSIVTDQEIPLSVSLQSLIRLIPEGGPHSSHNLRLMQKLGAEIPRREEGLTLPTQDIPKHAAATLISAWHLSNPELTRLADEVFHRHTPEDIVPLLEEIDPEAAIDSVTDFSQKAIASGEMELAKRILTSSSDKKSSQHLSVLLHLSEKAPLPPPTHFRTGNWKALLELPASKLTKSPTTTPHVESLLTSFIHIHPKTTSPHGIPNKIDDLSPWTGLERAIASHDISAAFDYTTVLNNYGATVALHLSAGLFEQIEPIRALQSTQHTGLLGCEIPYILAPTHLRKAVDYTDLFTKTKSARSRDITALFASAVRDNLFETTLTATVQELEANRLTEQHIPAALFPDHRKSAHWLIQHFSQDNVEETLRSTSQILSQKATPEELKNLFLALQDFETPTYGQADTLLTLLELYPHQDHLRDSALIFPKLHTTYRDRNRLSTLLRNNTLLDSNKQFWKAIIERYPRDASARYQNGEIQLARLLPLSNPAKRLALARTMKSCNNSEATKAELTLISQTSPLDQPATITALNMLGNSAFNSKDYNKAAQYFALHSIGTLLSDQSYSTVYSYITPASRMAESYGMIALSKKNSDIAEKWFFRARAIDISADLLGRSLVTFYQESSREKDAKRISALIAEQNSHRLTFLTGAK